MRIQISFVKRSLSVKSGKSIEPKHDFPLNFYGLGSYFSPLDKLIHSYLDETEMTRAQWWDAVVCGNKPSQSVQMSYQSVSLFSSFIKRPIVSEAAMESFSLSYAWVWENLGERFLSIFSFSIPKRIWSIQNDAQPNRFSFAKIIVIKPAEENRSN